MVSPIVMSSTYFNLAGASVAMSLIIARNRSTGPILVPWVAPQVMYITSQTQAYCCYGAHIVVYAIRKKIRLPKDNFDGNIHGKKFADGDIDESIAEVHG